MGKDKNMNNKQSKLLFVLDHIIKIGIFLIISCYLNLGMATGGTTSGEILEIYSHSPEEGHNTIVMATSNAFIDFRLRNWHDNYYEWVRVDVNGESGSSQIPIEELRRTGNTISRIPVNVSGICSNAQAVLWVGRRDASPVRSDVFNFSVDCEEPQIRIQAFETGAITGGTYTTPIEVRSGNCRSGSGFHFDIQVTSNDGIVDLITNIEGPSLQGAIPEITHRRSTYDASEVVREMSVEHFAHTPRATRPNNVTQLVLTVNVTELSGRRVTRSYTLGIGPNPDAMAFNIESPTSPSIIPFNSAWSIEGVINSVEFLRCGLIPDVVEIWHAIPGGPPRKISEARVNTSGRYMYPVMARSIPVGNNEFFVQVPLLASGGSQVSGLRSTARRNNLNVTITPLSKEVVDKVNQPLPKDTTKQIPRPKLPGVPLD